MLDDTAYKPVSRHSTKYLEQMIRIKIKNSLLGAETQNYLREKNEAENQIPIIHKQDFPVHTIAAP